MRVGERESGREGAGIVGGEARENGGEERERDEGNEKRRGKHSQ